MGLNILSLQFGISFLAFAALAGIAFWGFRKTGQKGFMIVGIAAVCSIVGWFQPLLIFARDLFQFPMGRELSTMILPTAFSFIRIAGALMYAVGIYLLVDEYPQTGQK